MLYVARSCRERRVVVTVCIKDTMPEEREAKLRDEPPPIRRDDRIDRRSEPSYIEIHCSYELLQSRQTLGPVRAAFAGKPLGADHWGISQPGLFARSVIQLSTSRSNGDSRGRTERRQW